MGVITLNSKQGLIDLQEKGDKFVILFWAAWHEPSKKGGQMQGIQFALSDKFTSITFCSVEAEEVPEISEMLSISVVPTFVAFHGKTLIGKVEGVQPAEVSSLVKKLNELSALQIVNNKEKEVVDLNIKLERLINLAPVMLFMKGSPTEPKSGFSRQIVEILKTNEIPFATFDILTDDEVRAGLKVFSDWPTYPQLYVKGVLIGGLDIVKEMQQEGNLKESIGVDSFSLPSPIASIDERLKTLIDQSEVMVFIKGSPSEPRCGFSKTLVGILAEENITFSHFDILTDDEVRAGLKVFSDWPTYPQLYVKGVLIGGLDIIKEMRQEGPLKTQFDI